MARVTRNDFFEAALKTLREQDFLAVSAVGLCRDLDVTRGSFYHHFESLDDFVAALMTYWRETYTEALFAQMGGLQDQLSDQLRRNVHMAAQLPHKAEAALRAWATVNCDVQKTLNQVDEMRRSTLVDVLLRYGISDVIATRYACVSMAAIVGAQMVEDSLTEDRLNEILHGLHHYLMAEYKASVESRTAGPRRSMRGG